MMQMTDNSNISDELWIVHHACQELVVVVGLQGLLLQQFRLLGLDGGDDRDLQQGGWSANASKRLL